jgi:hypothetical protein
MGFSFGFNRLGRGLRRSCSIEPERGVGMARIKQDKKFLWIGRILRIL